MPAPRSLSANLWRSARGYIPERRAAIPLGRSAAIPSRACCCQLHEPRSPAPFGPFGVGVGCLLARATLDERPRRVAAPLPASRSSVASSTASPPPASVYAARDEAGGARFRAVLIEPWELLMTRVGGAGVVGGSPRRRGRPRPTRRTSSVQTIAMTGLEIARRTADVPLQGDQLRAQRVRERFVGGRHGTTCASVLTSSDHKKKKNAPCTHGSTKKGPAKSAAVECGRIQPPYRRRIPFEDPRRGGRPTVEPATSRHRSPRLTWPVLDPRRGERRGAGVEDGLPAPRPRAARPPLRRRRRRRPA